MQQIVINRCGKKFVIIEEMRFLLIAHGNARMFLQEII